MVRRMEGKTREVKSLKGKRGMEKGGMKGRVIESLDNIKKRLGII